MDGYGCLGLYGAFEMMTKELTQLSCLGKDRSFLRRKRSRNKRALHSDPLKFGGRSKSILSWRWSYRFQGIHFHRAQLDQHQQLEIWYQMSKHTHLL